MEPYQVALETRIREILGEDFKLDSNMVFNYSWENGDERLTISYSDRKGGLDFRGIYHPNAVCEGGGVCKYCGITLKFD